MEPIKEKRAGAFVQAGDRLYKQQTSINIFWISVSLFLWTVLSALPYLNQSKGLYLATICSGEGKSVIIVDREGQPIKSKTWCLDCIVPGFITKQSFTVAELLLTEHKVAYNALKADLDKSKAVQHYFQTGPPEIL